MGVWSRDTSRQTAVAPQIEPFAEYAHRELAAAPLIAPGVCFQPECGRSFEPSMPWQIYCSRGCADASKREMRSYGHKAAMPLLVHRIGKYSTDGAVRDRTRAARRYLTRLQSEWLKDREGRGA